MKTGTAYDRIKGFFGRSGTFVKRRFVIAAAALLIPALFCACSRDVYPVEAQSADDYRLKVLQFNVQTENGNGTPFETRASMYRELIDDLQPDVVGMQEVTVKWIEWLDKKVFNGSYAGLGEARTPGGEANSIYYRKDKFDLVDSGTFWLSDSPETAGSAFRLANYPRICTWVRLKDKKTDTEFVHLNTHLDHNGANDSSVANTVRKDQMSVIVKFASRFAGIPVFLTGDLNSRRTTSSGDVRAVYKLATGLSSVTDGAGNTFTLNLSDSRLDSPVTVDAEHLSTMAANYDKNGSSYNPGREPIDYIFYSSGFFEALSYETFLIGDENAMISDHLPVFATFRLVHGS